MNLLCILSLHFKTWNNILGVTSNTGKIYTLQMNILRIIADAQPKTSCRSLFKQLEILPVPCYYILSLMNFIINNKISNKIISTQY